SFESVHQVAEEGVAPELSVGDDVDPDLLLHRDRGVHGPVLDVLELGRWNLRRLDAPPRVHQLRRAEQAADNLAARFSCADRATVAAPDSRTGEAWLAARSASSVPGRLVFHHHGWQ